MQLCMHTMRGACSVCVHCDVCAWRTRNACETGGVMCVYCFQETLTVYTVYTVYTVGPRVLWYYTPFRVAK